MPRPRAWSDSLFDTSIPTGGDLLSNLLAELVAVETATVTRLIGHLNLQATSTGEVEYAEIVDVGIGVVSKEAFDVGVTAVPDPHVAGDVPARGWLYRARRLSIFGLPSVGGPFRIPAIFDFDVRAARRVDRGRLFMYIHTTNTGGTGTQMELVGLVRALALT